MTFDAIGVPGEDDRTGRSRKIDVVDEQTISHGIARAEGREINPAQATDIRMGLNTTPKIGNTGRIKPIAETVNQSITFNIINGWNHKVPL